MQSIDHMVDIQEQRLTSLLAAFNAQKENLVQTSKKDKGRKLTGDGSKSSPISEMLPIPQVVLILD